mgnify:CR=1 FL=1
MKNHLFFTVFFFPIIAFSQVGIGTSTPNSSSILDLESTEKGVLIPRISLQSITDNTTITNGNVESLLVYNTNATTDLVKGFYFWSIRIEKNRKTKTSNIKE